MDVKRAPFVRRQQSEEGEKNGSEDDDEEKPGKRVMGPRKKFLWDDRLRSGLAKGRQCGWATDGDADCAVCLFRSLLCNLVRVKLGCYELEGKNTLSLEDYLKAFMETEVKPLWPKGWMQARSASVLRLCDVDLLPECPPPPHTHCIGVTKVCLCSQDTVQREHHGSRSPHGLHVSHVTSLPSRYLFRLVLLCLTRVFLFFFSSRAKKKMVPTPKAKPKVRCDPKRSTSS